MGRGLRQPRWTGTRVAMVVVAGVGVALLSVGPSGARTGHSKAWKIRDAMSAAPRAVSRGATILDWPKKAGDAYPVLRKGTNGWTCFPDDPATPGDDPWCMDGASRQWLDAWSTGREPKLEHPGLSYMLRGGVDASNTDPMATRPPRGQRWLKSPPHMMVFPVGPLDPAVYGSDPKAGRPWIMWAGTPYQHLMLPVR